MFFEMYCPGFESIRRVHTKIMGSFLTQMGLKVAHIVQLSVYCLNAIGNGKWYKNFGAPQKEGKQKTRLVYHNSRDMLICHHLSWCSQPVQSFPYPSSIGLHDLTRFRATLLYVQTFAGIFRYICMR